MSVCLVLVCVYFVLSHCRGFLMTAGALQRSMTSLSYVIHTLHWCVVFIGGLSDFSIIVNIRLLASSGYSQQQRDTLIKKAGGSCGRKRRIGTDSKIHCVGAEPPCGALSQWRLFDPVKSAYDQLDGWLTLTASAFSWLKADLLTWAVPDKGPLNVCMCVCVCSFSWLLICMPAVLVTVSTVVQNSLFLP